jgi:hypothetical protein
MLGRYTRKGVRSWWPLIRSFEHTSAGENFGRWTQRSEEDYQEKLRQIEEGTHTPITAKKWRDLLRGQKMAKDLRAHYREAATEVITR